MDTVVLQANPPYAFQQAFHSVLIPMESCHCKNGQISLPRSHLFLSVYHVLCEAPTDGAQLQVSYIAKNDILTSEYVLNILKFISYYFLL